MAIQAIKDWWNCTFGNPMNHSLSVSTLKRAKALRDGEEPIPSDSTERLRKLVDDLDPKVRETLILHVNEGLTYREIAKRLQVTEPVVLRRLTKAYSYLRMNGVV